MASKSEISEWLFNAARGSGARPILALSMPELEELRKRPDPESASKGTEEDEHPALAHLTTEEREFLGAHPEQLEHFKATFDDLVERQRVLEAKNRAALEEEEREKAEAQAKKIGVRAALRAMGEKT